MTQPERIFQIWMLTALVLLLCAGTSPAAAPAIQYDVAFASYFGGTNFDSIRDVCVDAQSNIIAVGGTSSPDFPTTPGAWCRKLVGGGESLGDAGSCDAFVAKFDASGHLLWSTYLGGPNYDRAYGVAVDGKGNIYVAGRAGEGFPVTPGAFQTGFEDTSGGKPGFYGKQNGFAAKLTPEGKLLWASYVGSAELCRDIAVDDDGDVYLPSGWSGTGQPPPAKWFANGFQKTPKQGAVPATGADTCVLKIKSDGSQVLWGTWLCGSGNDSVAAMVRVDAQKNVYYATATSSRDMPIAGKGRGTYGGGDGDFYAAKLSADGARLIYGTYLGGSGDEEVDTHELTVNSQGNAYLAIWSTSADWPITPGVFQPKRGDKGATLAICKLGPDGALLACSYLGGSHGGENAEGINVDVHGNVYVTGTTHSADFPTAGSALQATYGAGGGGCDGNAFMTVIAADFRSLLYSSFVGRQCSITGKNAYGGFHCSALAPDGSWVVAGSWHTPGWPIRNAYHATYYGGPTSPPYAASDAVLARFLPRP